MKGEEQLQDSGDGKRDVIVIRTDSKADAVTVYEQWAHVRRRAEVFLPTTINSDGEQKEVHLFFAMPECFDRDSVQVRFDEQTAECVVLRGVVFEDSEITGPNTEEEFERQERHLEAVRSIREQIHTVTKQLEHNKLELAEVNDELGLSEKLFSRVCGPLTDNLPQVLDAAFWELQLAEVETRVSRANEARRRLIKSGDELRAELHHLNEQLNALDGGHCVSPLPSERKRAASLCIVLKVTKALAKAVVFVTYMMTNASWGAEYEMRLDSSQKQITLYYIGVVHAGGEEFDNVALTLSSAKPRKETEEPKLKPWRLSAAVKPKPCETHNGQYRRPIEMRACMRSCAPQRLYATAKEQTGGVVSFTLPSRHTLCADGSALRVPLTELRWKAEITYVTVPSLVESVYAKATCTNESEYLLIPGDAAVLFDGDFVANTYLERTAPGEQLNVDFGVDSTIEVRRKLVQCHTTCNKASLFNRDSKQRLLYSYTTTLVNKKQHEAITVVLQERVPKSNDKKLTVQLIEPKGFPMGDGEQQRKFEVDGIVELQVTLNPGDLVTLPFSFEVMTLANTTITGL